MHIFIALFERMKPPLSLPLPAIALVPVLQVMGLKLMPTTSRSKANLQVTDVDKPEHSQGASAYSLKRAV